MTYVTAPVAMADTEPYCPESDLAYLAFEIANHTHKIRELPIDVAFDIATLLKSYFRHIEANFSTGSPRSFENRPIYFQELNDQLEVGMQEITGRRA